MNYEKVSSYPYKESLRLERIRNFLGSVGNPQAFLKCIHIAGSKGKGSTCAFIAYILRKAGYKVGLYTSPHLSDFRERVRILNPEPIGKSRQSEAFEGMISREELVELTERLKPAIDEYNKNSKYGPLSFFEIYTSLALIYFKEKKTDFVVLETGLGGRLDATNVVYPLVCAITSLSYEHTQKLGNTLKEIAAEKAGIIKAGGRRQEAQSSIVISAPQEKEAMEVIRKKCKVVGVKMYEVNKDIFYEKARKGFNVLGIFSEYPNLETRLVGRHQFINASVAIGVIEALRFYDIMVGVQAIREGLYDTVWPGRCEVISLAPLVILDGAQNAASAKALSETIKDSFKYKKLILVLGISDDKDIRGVCSQLNALADEIILTKADNPRAANTEALEGYFKEKKLYKTCNIKEALELAKQRASAKDLILVTGSLFVVGEARELLYDFTCAR